MDVIVNFNFSSLQACLQRLQGLIEWIIFIFSTLINMQGKLISLQMVQVMYG